MTQFRRYCQSGSVSRDIIANGPDPSRSRKKLRVSHLQLLQTVEQVRQSLNPALIIQGIVMTMYDGRNNLANQVVDDVRAYMGDKVYQTIIPRNVRISEAPSHGKPAILYDLKCSGSQAYLQLASEVIQRERRLRAA